MIATASLPLAMLFVQADENLGCAAARLGLMLFAAATLAASAPLLNREIWRSCSIFFILIPAVFAIIFASLWLLASDIFETTPEGAGRAGL